MPLTARSPRRPNIAWIALCLALAAILSLPSSASADIVSGKILGLDDKPIPNGSFVAKDAKGGTTTFKSNAEGNYSVFLEPGKYTVTYGADATVTATLESFPQPRQADIKLKKIEGK